MTVRFVGAAILVATLAFTAGCTPFGYYSIGTGVLGEALSPTVTDREETPEEPEPDG